MTNIFKRFIESLPEEERKRIEEYTKLEAEHTYYKTETVLDVDIKQGEEVIEGGKQEKQEVKVYRDVYGDHTLGEKILISFGGYREYAFDQNFLNFLHRDTDKRFCIDAGANTYVKATEFRRILEEAKNALASMGIEIEEDYYKTFRQSDMGKMVEGMGLL